jgi:hypothetical protein
MTPTKQRSRIHLLAAKEAPIVVLLQRKRAKLFHIIKIDTEKHSVQEGSWFRGRLYEMKCDVSFDGEFMVYLAIGKGSGRFTSSSGLCRLPWLKTLVECQTPGPNWGGGYFADRKVLVTNGWKEVSPTTDIPFTLTHGPLTCAAAEHRGILDEKFERDGFTRSGDDAWAKRPSLQHPELKVRYLGYQDGDHFAFSLEERPELVEGASWATWDSRQNLWVARPGIVEQYTLNDLRSGVPSYSLDVDRFEPPPKPDRSLERQS